VSRSGRCLCGRVRYELAGELGPLVNCHCQFCRRAHGAAFVTVTWVRRADLRFTAGADLLREYRSENVGVRTFCAHCGTRFYNQAHSTPDFVALIVGSLDADPTTPPALHVNVESKAAWYEILDGRPQFDALPEAATRALDANED